MTSLEILKKKGKKRTGIKDYAKSGNLTSCKIVINKLYITRNTMSKKKQDPTERNPQVL